MVARPGTVLVLHLEALIIHAGMPGLPFLAAGAAQAVADVEVGEELLASDRAIARDKAVVGELSFDRGDLLRIVLTIALRSTELFQNLGLIIERYTRRSLRARSGRSSSGLLRVHLHAGHGGLSNGYAFAPRHVQTLGCHRGPQDRRPATGEIPASILQLVFFDFGDALLQAPADTRVELRIAHAAVQPRQQFGAEEGVDVRPQLTLDLRSLPRGDR